MEATDRQILHQFTRQVQALDPAARVWAFGSRARGDAHPESDLDLCVVLARPTEVLRRSIRDVAWELSLEHERVLAPLIFSEEGFENGPMSASSLVARIRREGVAP